MKTLLPSLCRLLSTTLTLLLLSVTPLLAQTFANYAPAVCPNQTVTYVLEGIPADYRIMNPSATGGLLRNSPSVSNGRAEYVVTWNFGTNPSITPGLEMPTARNANGNVTAYGPATPNNVPSVFIKSLLGRNINSLINGTSTIELPLCGGAQTLTLSLPEQYFDDNSRFPITSYLWNVPGTFTVVGGQPAPGFGSSSWLSGRSITIQVPAGQFDEVVAVRLWGRECEGANLNPLNSQLSNQQIIRIRRTLPTITNIAASRPSLNCGDQSPLTLTANTSQQGANSFTWTLPTGWSFAPNTSTTAATVTVVPSGSGGGTASATA